MRISFCLLTFLLLVSCKSTSVTNINTGLDPKWAGEQRYEVLVAVLSLNPELRVLFEDEMAEALRKEGITAVQSYTVIPSVQSLNAETFSKFLSASPTLAVYFTQAKTVSKQETKESEKDRSFLGDLLGSGQWDTTFIAMMESGIYVNQQSEAVWWNRVRLEAKDKEVDEVAKQYVRKELKAMKQGGAISRLQ